jgi:predicted lipoprotein
MQRLLMLALASAMLAGCTTARKSPHRSSSSEPIYTYNAPDQDAIRDRARELENRGASHDGAVSKATREAERQAWTSDSTEAWQGELARRAYQQQQDELNAGLRQLLADRATR